MGCDIHMFVEHREKSGKPWKNVYKKEVRKIGPDYSYDVNYYGYGDRNYDLFGILAGVRSYECEPIAKRRGLPKDVSEEIKKESDRWDSDGHSHTYLTLEELLAFDWSKPFKQHPRLVEKSVYEAWDKKGYPSSCCGDAFGPNIEKLEQAEYEHLKAGGHKFDTNKTYYIRMSFDLTYADAAEHFLDETVPRLMELGEPEDVRIVFWFDN
jgi:hypothetical protein